MCVKAGPGVFEADSFSAGPQNDYCAFRAQHHSLGGGRIWAWAVLVRRGKGGCHLLQHARGELHGLMVLLLQHVHVQLVQEVVAVIVHPALVQLHRESSPHGPQTGFLLLSFTF